MKFHGIALISLSIVISGIESLPTRRQSPMIIGGHDVTIQKAPYQVSLRSVDSNHLCGGVIIDRRWLLTAAHCFHRNRVAYVVAGTNRVSSGGARYNISKIIKYPFYNSETNNNDIALIKTKEDFKYSESIQPIAIGSERLKDDTIVTVTGWGWTSIFASGPDKLKTTRVKVLNLELCSAITEETINSSTFCTIGNNKGSCFGDSGGPLVYNGQLYGIVSYGDDDCNKDYPDINTNVPSFKWWISVTKFIYAWTE